MADPEKEARARDQARIRAQRYRERQRASMGIVHVTVRVPLSRQAEIKRIAAEMLENAGAGNAS